MRAFCFCFQLLLDVEKKTLFVTTLTGLLWLHQAVMAGTLLGGAQIYLAWLLKTPKSAPLSPAGVHLDVQCTNPL
jgi:hypothetical protein